MIVSLALTVGPVVICAQSESEARALLAHLIDSIIVNGWEIKSTWGETIDSGGTPPVTTDGAKFGGFAAQLMGLPHDA